MSHMRKAAIIGAISFLGTACTKVPQADDSQVASIVQERVAKRVHWYQGTIEDQQVQSCIEHLLQQDLKLDAAVQIALLNNPQIQATFEDLGIRQADLVQAGLFQNPIFDGFVRFPTQRSLSTNTEFSVAQGFLNFFLIPLRKKVATTELEQTQLRVANVVLDLTFDVRDAYYSLQAEQTKLGLLEHLVRVTDASNLLAKKQRQVGNINDLELQSRTSEYLEAKLDLSKTQNQIAHLRQEINMLLGLRPSQISWHILDELPALPSDEVSMETLETRALSQRLDLAQARLELKRIAQMGATKEWWAFTDPMIGISGEKDTDGSRVLGPTFSAVLPFFDHGQADRARLFSMFKQSQHQLQALEIDVQSQVRQAIAQLNINRNRVLICINELLPLHENIIGTSQNFYNVMGLSVYRFLHNKQQQLRAKIEYTMSLGDYWKTRVDLDRAVGGEIKNEPLPFSTRN